MRVRSFLIFASLALAGTFWTGAAQANMEDIVSCSRIDDDAARLACYDGAVAGVRAEIEQQDETVRAEMEEEHDQRSFFGLPHFSVPSILTRRETTPEEFGSAAVEQREAREEGRVEEMREEERVIDEINATVVEWGRNPRGKIFVVLDNGHVWRLVGTQRLALNRNGPNTVRIRRGRLGSFFIKANNVSAEYRVERLR